KSDFPSDVMNNNDYWPTEIDDISYTGQEKALLNGAKNQAPEGYTLKYSTDGENWSNSIPEGTDAGDYKVYVKYTSNDGNHSDSEPKEYSFIVAKKAASVSVNANQGKTYGESDPVLTASTDGTIGSDTLNYTLSRVKGEDAGEYAVTVTPGTNKNYNVTVTGGTFTIAKKEVTLTAVDKSKTYGESDPEFTATAGENDIVGTDTLNYTVSRVEGENAGEYDITVAVGENKNYEVMTIGGKLTIQKKSITIQADSISKPYGDPDPELTATVNGLVGDDTLNYELGRSEGDAIQDYDINVTLGENPNYDVIITPVEKPFSITKRSIILTSATETKTYDGSVLTNNQITVSGDGWLDGDGATYDVTGSQKMIGKSENTFTYKLNEGTNPDFYDISTVVGTLTVTDRDDASKYEITVKSKGGEYTYDSKEHSTEGFETLEFTINGEKYTVSGLSASAKGTNAGTYSSVISGNAIITDSTGNDVTSQFKVTKSNGELIINKAAPEVNKPEGIEITTGTKLSDIELPEGWSWENPDTVVSESGTATFKLVYTPKDSTNYKSVVVDVTVTVEKDGEEPTDSDVPEKNDKEEDGEVPTSFDEPEESEESEAQSSSEKYDREWVDGQWYDADGNADYASKGSWKHSDKGWWYEDETGWYPTDSWMKVDGKWYFFDEYGFMISNQYCGKWSAGNEGLYWVGIDGAWNEGKPAYWYESGNKRWLGDETGWYAHDCRLLVNGTYLEFDSDGFLK
ncbi:MAG: hypothetical protein II492_00285, partial [Eubacterium sp.]|nr:hypothetical protein [Eubacterium sp.]